ncbi:hypothetical protein [Xylanibacter muris]|nr:hypothetical protein [Xylanibacter muris]
MNNTFDMKRFGRLAACHLADTWKAFVKQTLGICFALTISYCFTVWEQRNLYPAVAGIKHTNQLLCGFTLLAFYVFITISAAAIFANMKTKQQRITFMMLPASNLEKFLIRFLTVTIGYFLCFTTGFIMADILQMTFRTAVTGVFGFHSIVWEAIRTIWEFLTELFSYTPPEDSPILLIRSPLLILLTIIIGYIHIHSVYTLGGVLFRKHAWLLTTCAIFTVSFMITIFAGDLFEKIMELPFSFGKELPEHVLGIYLTGMTVMTALFYWASYKLFTRMQVINNKWINI